MSENFENKVSSQRVVRRGIVPRLTIRVGYGTMSFFLPKQDGTVEYQPYTVKSGVSMAANLRTAFRESDLLKERDDRALLSVVSPVVLVPVDEYMDHQDGFDLVLSIIIPSRVGSMRKRLPMCCPTLMRLLSSA